MNKISRILTLVMVFIFAIGLSTVDAQYYGKRKKKKKKKTTTERVEKKKKESTDDYFDDRGNFGSRLWYGANIGSIGGAAGTFQINISPIVGYKITDDVSAGVAVKFDYFYIGQRSLGIPGIRKYESVDLGPTAFVRGKLFETFFVHSEFEFGTFERPAEDEFGNIILDGDKIQTMRDNENFLYVGAGYNGGRGGLGYEIGLYYNVLDSAETFARDTPWDLRLGLTYKF